MVADQNYPKTNGEPIEDGLSALKQLAALDSTGADASHKDKSPQTHDLVETIPDWLELLLAKYGEQAAELVGLQPDLLTGAQPIDLSVSSPQAGEASEVASLLEQMAAEAEIEPPTEGLATSVDWGKPARYEDGIAEERTTDWPDRIAQVPVPPPTPAVEEETPDWLSELGESRPESEVPTEGPVRPVAEEEVPDWLQEIPSMPKPSDIPQPTEPAQPEMAPSEAELPDWLEDLGRYAPGVEGQPAEEALLAPEDEIPDWMKELDVTEPLEAEEISSIPDSEAPDWLKDLEAAPSQTEEEFPARGVGQALPEVTGAEETERELPDWLAHLTDMSTSEAERAPLAEPPPLELPPTPSAPITAEAPAQAEEEVPDWLRELESAGEVPPIKPALPEMAPPPPHVAAETPVEVEEEVSDWLRDVGTTQAGPAPEPAPPAVAPSEAEEEIPDWLRDLEATGEIPAAEPPPAGVPPTPPSELIAEAPGESEKEAPVWPGELREAEYGPDVDLPSPESAARAAAVEAEVPDWLVSLRRETPSPLETISEGETPRSEYPEAEPVEEPEWLAALRTSSKSELLEVDEPVVAAGGEELPDWLAELRASQAAVETPPPVLEVPAQPIEPEEIVEPEEFPPPAEVEAVASEIEEPLPAMVEAEPSTAEETEVLGWLAEIQAAVEAPEYAEDVTSPGEGEIPPLREEVPDWLRQMPPADLAEEAGIPETEKETVETHRRPEWLVAEPVPGPSEEVVEVSLPPEETLEVEEAAPAAEAVTPAEIPDWLLKLKPGEMEPAALHEEEAVESEDVLAGIPGLLPLAEEEPEVEEEPIAALRSRIGVPEVPDVEGAKLFKEVVSERPDMERVEVEPATEARRGRIVETLVWAMIFIILIAGIVLALLAVLDRVGNLSGNSAFPEFFGSPLVIDPAPVNTFRAQVTKLPPDSVVVVAFDYGPATEAEMEPLAQIILRDLLDNQARVIAVSLRPEGPLLAQRLLGRFESEHPYGERTINLGYLPGQTAGVRSLAFLASAPLFQDWTHTLNDYSAWQDVNSLEDVALVVTLADSPLAVRWWVEQMGPGTTANRPMIAAVSAAADPSVRPYYNRTDPQSGQLFGLVSGVTDAAAYENRLGQPARAVRSLAAQSVAHLGLIVIGLGGTVMGFRMQATREE